MIYKKRTILISAKIGTYNSNCGKIDTFESIYWHSYLLFTLIINSKISLFMV
jgi:hypothetical protein